MNTEKISHDCSDPWINDPFGCVLNLFTPRILPSPAAPPSCSWPQASLAPFEKDLTYDNYVKSAVIPVVAVISGEMLVVSPVTGEKFAVT
jgi:hypothetical protein